MYELKRIPEDFIVEEVSNRTFNEGKYAVFFMTKRNYNTEDAIFKISDFLKIQRKNISYAGTKDRNAITSQYITILNAPRSDAELKDITLKYVGTTNKPLSLGDLDGNKFKITIRNLSSEKIVLISDFVNYFDEQRFSKNNVVIGRAIIKKDYAAVCKIIIEEGSRQSEEIKVFLEKNKNAYLNALKIIPKKILLIYVHAYQSSLWNNIVKSLAEKNVDVKEIPLPGFDVEPDESIKEVFYETLASEEISLRDFILRDFPEISLEGANRKVKAEIKNLKVHEFEDDEINEGKKKVVVEFFLYKGNYATMAIKNLVV
ncbi:MAG: tRNA pseudouridine(13) synthase TruD [Candidatus Nanoarchaeia archaeon]